MNKNKPNLKFIVKYVSAYFKNYFRCRNSCFNFIIFLGTETKKNCSRIKIVRCKILKIKKIASEKQLADVLTKPLVTERFEKFLYSPRSLCHSNRLNLISILIYRLHFFISYLPLLRSFSFCVRFLLVSKNLNVLRA